MSSYYQSEILSSAQAVSWATSPENTIQKQNQARRAVDTLVAAKRQEEKTRKEIERVTLIPAKPQEKDYLMKLASAFSKIYSTMAGSSIQQTRDLTELQELDQTMSQIVLDSASKAISKQRDELAAQQKLQQELQQQQKMAKFMQTFNRVLIGVTIGITLISALFDFGTSLLVIPEEVGAEVGTEATIEGSEALGESGEEGVVESGDSATGEAEEPGSTGSTGEVEGSGSDAPDEETEQVQQTKQANKTTVREATSNKGSRLARLKKLIQRKIGMKEGSRGAKRFLKAKNGFQKGTKVFGVAGAFAYAIPEGMQAYSKIEVASYLENLKKLQQEVGPAVSALQYNKGYMQFFQELVQRTTGVAQEVTSELADVISTAGSIFSKYREIPYQLAQVSHGLAGRA